MATDDRHEDLTTEDLARLAVSKANAAANHALAAHQEIGRVAAAVARLEGGQREILVAVEKLNSRRSLPDLSTALAERDDDTTLVRNAKQAARDALTEKVAALEKERDDKIAAEKDSAKHYKRLFIGAIIVSTVGLIFTLISTQVFHLGH